MCGFVGGTEPDWNYTAALAAIAHRGPDAVGMTDTGPIRAGFRRLSIIDLDDAANQPMHADDGSAWIVFNGEIYGYLALRRTLASRGYRFRTTSDTEVLLAAFRYWGHGFVEHVDGMFAIAIWDAATHSLTLYRDRAGIKPLYYYFDGRRFAFGSELKALRELIGESGLDRDPTALYDFLGYRYVPSPKTMYRDCYKLPPGHTVRYDADHRRLGPVAAFWQLEIPADPEPAALDEAAVRVRELIEASVAEQMIADVPLGFFLSGGVDSSVVVAAASRIRRRSADAPPPGPTFAIGFDTDAASETPYAREVARLCGTEHHERILMPDAAGALLPQLRAWFDEPFADESALPTYLVSRTARERVTVVLTGDGGDEVFGGYRTYPRYERNSRGPCWPRFVDRASGRLRARFGRTNAVTRTLHLLEMQLSDGPELWGKIMFGMASGEKAAFAAELGIPRDYDDWWFYRQHWRSDLPVRTRLQYLDFHTFMPELVLTKVDRTSMAVSLEARVPLLARRIVEYVFSLPESTRFPGGELKGLLRHAYREILPASVLDRRKKGFGIPGHYLRDVAGGGPIQAHILRRMFL